MQLILMRFFLIDRVIQEEGLYVYNMHNIVEKHCPFFVCMSISRKELYLF